MTRIVLTGAGSGGHITPLLAAAAELKRRQPKAELVYIGQRGDKLSDVAADRGIFDEVYSIHAGKFRRYHGEGLWQLLDIATTLKNLRDSVYVVLGLFESRRLLKRLQPKVIFIKGGYVGVPVGLAAASLHQAYVTHDSDAVPGLANRIIARWARQHAVAMPPNAYPYPADKTVMTGIPLQADFKPVTAKLKQEYRHDLNLPPKAKIVFAIGGGLGAQRVNQALASVVPHLLGEFPDLIILQAAGRQNEVALLEYYEKHLSLAEQGRVRVFGFVDDVYRYSGAADVIITRAGATNLAEFALQGKACIVVPSPFLAGGHQLENAKHLADKGAAEVINEADLITDANRLARRISNLLRDPDHQARLGRNLAQFAKPDATDDLVRLILEQV